MKKNLMLCVVAALCSALFFSCEKEDEPQGGKIEPCDSVKVDPVDTVKIDPTDSVVEPISLQMIEKMCSVIGQSDTALINWLTANKFVYDSQAEAYLLNGDSVKISSDATKGIYLVKVFTIDTTTNDRAFALLAEAKVSGDKRSLPFTGIVGEKTYNDYDQFLTAAKAAADSEANEWTVAFADVTSIMQHIMLSKLGTSTFTSLPAVAMTYEEGEGVKIGITDAVLNDKMLEELAEYGFNFN
jgi:phage antirepressor YoqD-like protein